VSQARDSKEPENPVRFTRAWDDAYTRFAGRYDLAVRLLPVWKTWLGRALPHIEGPRVLEVSFGTGYLMSQYAHRFETHGIDYNRTMVRTARKNFLRVGSKAELVQGSVESLPYPDATFDSLVNTMAFSGYPRGLKALAEMKRVLRTGGKLILIDFCFPPDQNWMGTRIAEFVERSGDIVRDMGTLFRECELEYSHQSIGAWNSVCLYVATRTG
jgi:ubiquinone/menaquinone biosynthesis C-methylase UbiE